VFVVQRSRPATSLLLACAVGLPLAGVLAGCGGDDGDEPLPSGTIARVGDAEITKAEYDRLRTFQLMRVSQQISSGKLFDAANPKLLTFTPPFTECIQKATSSIPAEARAQVTDAQIKQACEAVPERTKTETVQQLVATQVIAQQAKDDDIEVSDADVDKALDAAYTQEIGGRKNLAKFTAMTGLDTEIFKDLVRQSLTYAKVTEKVAKDAGPVTDADVKADYDKNKAQYGQPETRELHVVVAKDEADAQAARTALEGGATFASVATQYSTDAESKKDGGKLTKVQKGQLESAADEAAFSVGATQIAGPVKGDRGWYVIRVDKVTPGQTVPFDRIKTALKQQLTQTKPQDAVTKWQEDLLKTWKPKTQCAEGYNLVAFCKNQPKSATTTGAAPATGQ
jgi:foldase protein PrsA